MSIYGIDLGTTYSLIGRYTPEGYELYTDECGAALISSTVRVGGGQVIVGNATKQFCDGTLFRDTKRFIGKQWTSEHMTSDYDFNVTKCDLTGACLFEHPDGVKTPTEIAGYILTRLVEIAKDHGHDVKNVVITVPSYFSNIEKACVKEACLMAGINPVELINEPTAAAIYYYSDQQVQDLKNILVLDIGGSTTDITILDMDDHDYFIKGSRGDLRLGGIDIDKEIRSYFKFDTIEQAECYKCDPTTDSELLSKSTPEFEEKLITLVTQALKSSKLDRRSISKVLVLGGSSRFKPLPCILKRIFEPEIIDILKEPDAAVCLGACYRGYMLANSGNTDLPCLFDILPLSIGIEVKDSVFSPVLNQNDRKPVQRSKTYKLSRVDQRVIEFGIYEGDRVLVKDNYYLGKVSIDIPDHFEYSETVIDVKFSTDLSGIIKVNSTVECLGEKIENELDILLDSSKDNEKIKKAKECLQYKESDELIKRYIYYKNKLENAGTAVPFKALDAVTQDDVTGIVYQLNEVDTLDLSLEVDIADLN